MAIVGLFASSASAQLTVTATQPLLHASNQSPNVEIVVDFDRAVDPATLDEFRIWGSVSGPKTGDLELELGGARVRFSPHRPFGSGELVQFSFSDQMRAADGSALRTQGFVSSFRVATAAAPMVFTPISSWSADPTVFTRIYGAQVCDLDGDEYTDIALICENTSDVRVFLNTADASGSYGPMVGAPNATGTTPSPNESADMDDDGVLDIITCDTAADRVSILLGNGDGTFQPAIQYSTGTGPRGLALLDFDGDGLLDVACANTGSNDISMRRNLGNGVFGPKSFLPSGVDGAWSLAAADMNNDHIVDLVVGGRFGGQVRVHRSNGDGTFVAQPAAAVGGQTWMIACGDLDGDRNIDVSSANGPTGNGAILLGNGLGGFSPAVITPTAGMTTATDLGDLDGDGDLDWVLSSYGGWRWTIYTNNGAGAFTLQQTIFAAANPACAAFLDIDRDGDLDLALLDEIADTCTIYENGDLDSTTFCFGDGSAAPCPCANEGAKGHGCAHSSPTGGALLNARGRASVSSDSLALSAGGMPSDAPALLFQGAVALNGGQGLPFDDGLRCISMPTRRLGQKVAVNGCAEWGGPVGDAPLSQSGSVLLVGRSLLYQAWFRDPAPFCTNAAANLSNGVRVTWTP